MANGEPNKSTSIWLQILTPLVAGGAGGVIVSLITSYVDIQKLNRESATEQLEFAKTYLEQVITEDIDARLRIAEYFKHILADQTQRTRWTIYLDAIQQKREDWRGDYIEMLQKREAGTTLEMADQLKLEEMEKYFGREKSLQIRPRATGETKQSQEPLPTGETKPPQEPSEFGKRLASCAKQQVGVVEDQGRDNRSTQIDEYVSAVGGSPEEAKPWGTAFVAWCLKQTGLDDKHLAVSPNALEMWGNAQKKGFAITAADLLKTRDLQVGDIYIMTAGAGTTEIGIVTDVADLPLVFWSVQGDASPRGGAGFGVFERRLPLRMINLGVIRVSQTSAPDAAASDGQ